MNEDSWLEEAYEDRFSYDEDLRDYDEEAYNEWLMDTGGEE